MQTRMRPRAGRGHKILYGPAWLCRGVDSRPYHVACVDAHAAATPDATALLAIDALGRAQGWSWRRLAGATRRLAWHLRENHGIRQGDRVAIVLPQRAENAIAHVACARLGAITVPLSPLFGPDGLSVRLRDAAPRLALTDAPRAGVVRDSRVDVPLRLVDDAGFQALLAKGPRIEADEEARLGPEEPAFLVYTSGTTGGPKGALLPHRVIAGRMPGFLLAHEPFDAATTVFYSPADWSWIGGLMDSLLAPWLAGAAVVAHERAGPFDAAATYRLLVEHRVTNAFLPPTALKALARTGGVPPVQLALRAIHSAGEPLPPPVAAWAREALTPNVTEVYGLTEAAFLVGTAARSYRTPEGSMGRPYPTHRVRIMEEEICVERGDPTMMLGYWRGEGVAPHLPLDDAGLLHTGDLADADPQGFFRFLGRKDDLIKTSGYRVGPAEVEASLLRHPAVAECAVVGVPDAERGQVVKAFVRVAPGHEAGEPLAHELRLFVRERLAAHAYPRQLVFVDELPMTVSGKLRRRALRDG